MRFDVSTSDLTNLVKADHFVDKTSIITLNFQFTTMVMITAPRHFGRSTNLVIIKRFSKLEVYMNGTVIPAEDTESYTIFIVLYNKINGTDFLNIYI